MNAKPGRAAVIKARKSTMLCKPTPTTAFVENDIKSHSVFVIKENRKQTKDILNELPSILNAKFEDVSPNGPIVKAEHFDERPIMKGEDYSQMTKEKRNQQREENGAPHNVPCDILLNESSSVDRDSTTAVLSINGALPRLKIENNCIMNGRKPILAPLQLQPQGNAKRQFILHHTSFAARVPKENENAGDVEKPPAQVVQVQPAFNAPVIDKVKTEEIPRKQQPIFWADNSVSPLQSNCQEEQNGGAAVSYIPAFFAEEKQSESDVIPYCAKNKEYCYVCRKYVEKGFRLEVGATNWAVAGLCCSLSCYCGCCLIPFCIDYFKDEVEYCVECNSDSQ